MKGPLPVVSVMLVKGSVAAIRAGMIAGMLPAGFDSASSISA
jgi:hypothetical protein